MHGDVEQEGLYQNYKFGDPRGRGSDPRAGPNLVHSVSMYNILKTSSLMLLTVN